MEGEGFWRGWRRQGEQQRLEVWQRVPHIQYPRMAVLCKLALSAQLQPINKATYRFDVLVEQEDGILEPIPLGAFSIQWEAECERGESWRPPTYALGPCMTETTSLTRLLLPGRISGTEGHPSDP